VLHTKRFDARWALKLLAAASSIITLSMVFVIPAASARVSVVDPQHRPVLHSWSSSYVGTGMIAISCPGTQLCVAAGQAGNLVVSTDFSVLTGSSWKTVNVDHPGAWITSVSCPTTNFCAAVDNSGSVVVVAGPGDPSMRSRVKRIDGGQFMFGIACPSLQLCVAVDGQGSVLVSHNPFSSNSSWVSRELGAGSELTAVACASATTCVTTDNNDQVFVTFNASDNVQYWHTYSVPSIGADAVSCVRNGFCVFAGQYGEVAYARFDSHSLPSWHVDYLSSTAEMLDVACPTQGECVMVDSADQFFLGTATRPEAFTWLPLSVPRPASYGQMDGVSCASRTSCVGVDNVGDVVVVSLLG
jgi:hypothetical protein